jgi:hypothetical protein
MNAGLTVTRRFHVQRGGNGRRQLKEGEQAAVAASDCVPRVSRLMALAIRFERLLADGVVNSQADLARLGHVSRGRLTQIMNLLNLAPDIQEEILLLPAPENRRGLISETHLRPIAAVADWRQQRWMWKLLLASRSGQDHLSGQSKSV